MDLNGKIILVVGGATGIGRATAELCHQRGAEVLVGDILPAMGWEGIFYKVDVTDDSSVRDMFTEIDQHFGRLDALVQTAGILKGAFTPLSELDVATFNQVLGVNVTGSFLCAKYAEPLMKKNGAGVVILLSSGAATGGSSSLAYGSSKGAVNSLAITLTNRLAPHNIRVNVVSPGNIDTPMKRSVIEADAKRQGASMGKLVSDSHLGMPEGVAKLIAFLVSDDADYVRGLISTR
jgi:NAD(P)-dependent dehydrogenase (short-subunit alcohol dehydrogenase family)